MNMKWRESPLALSCLSAALLQMMGCPAVMLQPQVISDSPGLELITRGLEVMLRLHACDYLAQTIPPDSPVAQRTACSAIPWMPKGKDYLYAPLCLEREAAGPLLGEGRHLRKVLSWPWLHFLVPYNQLAARMLRCRGRKEAGMLCCSTSHPSYSGMP